MTQPSVTVSFQGNIGPRIDAYDQNGALKPFIANGVVLLNPDGSIPAAGSPTSSQLPASLGTKSAAASLSITPAGLEYETVAASQTDQVLGATGAAGDYLSHIVIQPATTGAGTCTIKDGTTVIFTFTTGTLPGLAPITVPFGIFSVNGAFKVTTGANVAIIGIGDFT